MFETTFLALRNWVKRASLLYSKMPATGTLDAKWYLIAAVHKSSPGDYFSTCSNYIITFYGFCFGFCFFLFLILSRGHILHNLRQRQKTNTVLYFLRKYFLLIALSILHLLQVNVLLSLLRISYMILICWNIFQFAP